MISRDCQILLGMKKKGFGRGLWQHSFCGKVEKGESVVEAAVRELEEESGLQVIDLKMQLAPFLTIFTMDHHREPL